MAKSKTVFICQECGYESLKWVGKCPSCGAWNSLQEEFKTQSENNIKSNTALREARSILEIKSAEYERYDTHIKELNRVLGGGLVQGSVTLISGDPGIGKSTLLLQVAANISSKNGNVLYISGEESEEQIKIRGDRLGANSPNLFILSETNMEQIVYNIESVKPKFVIIDSIQTVYNPIILSAPGSVSQVRECSSKLVRIAKEKNIPIFIVAHVTKQGELAGPRVLEHMVDTVLSFEGERSGEFRVLRSVKNRFGATSEIGVFQMVNEGLIEINNPSEVFLEETNFNQEGSVVIGIVEGTRPILVEVQALTCLSQMPIPRRTTVGMDLSRLNLILAVLEKKYKMPFYKNDVYVNVVGGLNIDGTFGDLGVALALCSSLKGTGAKIEKFAAVGEIGLTGEVRPVGYSDKIVNEASKMGFKNVILPKRNCNKISNNNCTIYGVSSLREAISKVF